MREIKFRAWDVDNKRWLTNYEQCYLCEDGVVGYMVSSGGYHSNDYMKLTNAIPCLFTGSKDKNGKEIYDGDFIRQSDTLFEIRSCVGGFECQIWKEFKQGGAEEGSCYVFSCLSEKYCEVVGNIYENPELLNMVKEHGHEAKEFEL